MFHNQSIYSETIRPSVSLIIPTLNEAKNLPLVLPYIPLDLVDEILLIDGRSTDNTIDVAKRLLPSIRIVHELKPGKGAALRRGFAESNGDILMVIDADGSHDPREIPRYIQALVEGADFVKGSRFTTLGGTTDMPRIRKAGNRFFTLLVNLLFSQSFTDLCYGYHAFWRHALNYLDLSTIDGFEIDASIYLQAVRKKLKVVDVPSYEGSRFYGVGKLQTFPDGWRVLRTIFREWRASFADPCCDPQIGFHSYGKSAGRPQETSGPEVVSATTDILPWDSGREFAQWHSYNLDEFFQHHQDLFSQQKLETLLPEVLVDVMEGLSASSGSLYLFKGKKLSPDKSFLVFGRKVEPMTQDHMHDTLEQGIAGLVLRTHQPVVIQSTSLDPRWLRYPWEENEHVSRSVIAFPLLSGEFLLALIILTRPDDRRFTEEDVDRLKNFRIRL